MQDLLKIQSQLAPSLKVNLTDRGFAQAANRDDQDKKDETNYDAVWVRDSAWVFMSLLQSADRKADARKMILALWDYYSSPEQVFRLEAVINDPSLVQDKMAVPHIRFDGKSKDLGDVLVNGQPEEWNHLQMDAHGLFLYSLGLAYQQNLIELKDFSKDRINVLSKFPLFFEKARFWQLEDAGAWEEINRRNSSSIAIVTRSMQLWEKELKSSAPLRRTLSPVVPEKKLFSSLSLLIENGLATVKQQISLGGESPNYDAYTKPALFRRADAALFNLVLPEPLLGLSENELRETLAIVESLKRPAGIIRYQNDSYQGGNYWIEAPGTAAALAKNKVAMPADTGDTSSLESFLRRSERLAPYTEAQWFFDSKLAMCRLQLRKLALQRNDTAMARTDLLLATLHLKRALGQITGRIAANQAPLIAADGHPVKDWSVPESINVVLLDGVTYYLPSPITPLNWAKASLAMALHQMESALKTSP